MVIMGLPKMGIVTLMALTFWNFTKRWLLKLMARHETNFECIKRNQNGAGTNDLMSLLKYYGNLSDIISTASLESIILIQPSMLFFCFCVYHCLSSRKRIEKAKNQN